jgi:hypothetical protein
MDQNSSHPAQTEFVVSSEAVTDGLNTTPDDKFLSMPSPGSGSIPNPAQGQPDPRPEALFGGPSTAEAPQPPPTEGKGQADFPKPPLNSWSTEENDAPNADFEEPAPRRLDMIQEISRGMHINGDTYFLFLLYSGRKILLCGDQLSDELKLLQRILAMQGLLSLSRDEKRELLELLQGISPDIKFYVIDRAGWYENSYIRVIRNTEYFIETKTYGKPSLPVYLKPIRATNGLCR